MKKTVMLGALVFFSLFCAAQTMEEWFNQKQTQIKYLVEQIAAFEVYSGYVKKGYRVTRKGLSNIRSIKNGDFNLHRDYFNSLKAVSSRVKRYGKIADIISLEASIVKKSKASLQAATSVMLTPAEKDYLEKVRANLLQEADMDIDQLLQITTDGELEMTDDERISRIDKLNNEMNNKVAFVQSFSNEVSLLVLQRRRELNEVAGLKRIHGL